MESRKFAIIYALIMAILRGLPVSGAIEFADKLPSTWGAFALDWTTYVPVIALFGIDMAVFVYKNGWNGWELTRSKAHLWILWLLVPALALSGCAHSGIHLNEIMEDGSSSELSISDTTTLGKQSTLQNFSYSGEGENPWRLNAGQEVYHDTTDALRTLQEMIATLSALAAVLNPPIAPPVAGP